MSLTLSLNNALTGLRANQQAISVLSHNIANANTEGYSRQIVEQSAQYIAGIGSGVRIDDVVRKVDKYLQRATQTQGAAVARTGVIGEYYERLNVLLGQPGSNNTLDEHVGGFFNSLQTLSETPDRSSARSDVLAAAGRLAGNVSNLAHDLHDLRFEADREIRESVTAINGLLTKLTGLNTALTRAGSLGQSTAGLLDQRDMALSELSGYLDITTSYDQYGEVGVIAGNGVALVDGQRHELRYNSAQSAEQFISDVGVGALLVVSFDTSGNVVGTGTPLISAGTTGNVTSQLSGGKLEGLRLMRDEVLPAMLDQLDMLASNLRDAVNAVHNDGSGFPPAATLTGTRPIAASQQYNWSGSVRIAVLQKDGSPVPAGYTNEAYTGWRPLTLDLGALNSGNGNGMVSMQSIVDEINNHFGAPLAKASLGNINSIKLVADSDDLHIGTASTFNFDFELENISGEDATFFLSGVTVTNSLGADMTNVTQGPPQILLDTATTYNTTLGIPDVTLTLQPPHNVQAGDWIYLGPPGTPDVNGIPAADITGYFQVQSVSGNDITIFANNVATATGNVADASGVYLQTAYQTVPDGEVTRTRNSGELQVDLSAFPSSPFYDITVAVATFDEDGNIQTSNITYRIQNDTEAMRGNRYGATGVTDDGVQTIPNTSQEVMRAILVDEDGAELPQVNGRYVDHSPSYLKLFSNNGDYVIAIDEIDSRQLGDIANVEPGTNRGFSHYFGLNDFFAANEPTETGDTVRGSAINLRVEQRLIDNPNLVTTGDLVLQRQPADPNAPPQWTYVRYSGDNQLATRLVNVSTQTINFDAAGGLPSIGLTFSGYTSELLGNIASNSAAASDAATNAQVLYDGFKTRSDAISGVNLDEELANTVILQNSYSATARIVTVVNQMFEDILQMI